MADHALFYNSVDHDRVYNADSFSDWLKKFFTTGVFTGDLFVTAAGSMNVSVGTGYVNINGKVMIYDAATQLTLQPANGIYPRIDTIVVERNDTDRDFYLKVVTGDYANLNDPVPTPPVRSGAIYQLVLAQIYVGAGVTEITQANITDTRADADLCGIVTGTVTEMDFSQFAAQFAAYYQEFKNGYELDFTNWSTQQRAAFDAWMADEQDDFDTWFANLHYILDGDVAGHLQNEIDALAAGMTGSIFEIQTSEPTLIGQTVTVTGPTKSMTATISNAGTAEIRGFDEVGTITISATDGVDTATTIINIPYFGNYPITLAFWQAIVNIQGDENLYGEDISVSNSSHILVDTVTLDSAGQGTFYASRADTYTFTATYSGETYTETLAVTEQTTYSVNIMTLPDGSTVTPTDDIQTWLRCAQILDKTTYTTLSEVLADSVTFNALLGDSNANKYMARSTSWAEQDGLVPTMTSDTTPSGECIRSTVYNPANEAYKAFDNDTSTWWNANGGQGEWIGYTFTEPTIVRKVVLNNTLGTQKVGTVKLQGKNSGDWTDVGSEFTPDSFPYTFIVNNGTAYSSYRIINISGTTDFNMHTIQFYSVGETLTNNQYAMNLIGQYDVCCDALLGNSTWLTAIASSSYADYVLNATVPKMTSNTAPSGTCFASIVEGGIQPYLAFDGDNSTNWSTVQSYDDASIGYQFPSAVCIRRAKFRALYGNRQFTVAYSDDGTNYTTCSETVTATNAETDYYVNTTETSPHKYWRLNVHHTQGASGFFVQTVQFYGHASSGEKIHGANEEVAYYLDGATQVPISNPSTLDAGTCTFGSTIAKNPDSLSSDYTKQIRITPNTVEVVLRPDKSLYWWGYENGITTERQNNAGTISKNAHNISITQRTATSYTIAQVRSQNAIDLSANSKICAVYNGSTNVAKGSYDICFTGYVNSASEFIDANSTQTGLTVALAKGEYTVTSSVSKYPCFGCAENATTYLSALWYE